MIRSPQPPEKSNVVNEVELNKRIGYMFMEIDIAPLQEKIFCKNENKIPKIIPDKISPQMPKFE